MAPADLFAVAAGVRHNRVRAELNLMTSPRGGQSIAHLILPIHQQRRLRSARSKRAPSRDRHLELRSENYRIESRNRRGKLELQPHAVKQGWADHRSLAELLRVSTPAKHAVDARQIVASHCAIRISIVKRVQIASEK